MNVNFDLKINIWTIIMAIIAVFMFFNILSIKEDVKIWENNYHALNTEHIEFISKYDSMIIYKDNLIQLTRNELKTALESDSIQKELTKKYKAAAAVVKIETVIKIDSILVPFPVYIDKDTTINIINKCLSLNISATNGLLALSNLTIENRQDIVLGKRKVSLWKTEQAFDIRNTNPCMITTGVTAYTVVVPRKWYEKWFITAPVSFATGYIIGGLTQ